MQLLVGMRHAVKLAQRCEIALDVFDASFDPPLLGRIGDRTRVNHEAVAQCQFTIGALYCRFVVTGLGDRAFGVVNPHFARHAVEPFEGVAVTREPGFDRLVAHHFGVLVPAPGQCHDEEPGLEGFVSLPVRDQRPRAKVDLRLFAHCEFEHDRCSRWRGGMTAYEAVHGMHAAGVSMLSDQCLPDAADRDALPVPGQHFFAVRGHG